MEYFAKIIKDDNDTWYVEFPDCEGCFSVGDTKEEAAANAVDALEGWLEAHLANGRVPTRPSRKTGTPIRVSLHLSMVLQLRWMRDEAGLTQGQLAKVAGISQQQVAKLENPDGNPTLSSVESVFEAMKAFVSLEVFKAPTPRKSRKVDPDEILYVDATTQNGKRQLIAPALASAPAKSSGVHVSGKKLVRDRRSSPSSAPRSSKPVQKHS
jgi:predicted RNase H-like HicB family nuclease/transcriptional regulator with XRE-family HTH domain